MRNEPKTSNYEFSLEILAHIHLVISQLNKKNTPYYYSFKKDRIYLLPKLMNGEVRVIE